MIKRRFIAGATCPKCHKIDKITMVQNGGQNSRECVACDFVEALIELPASEVQHNADVSIGIVKILDK